MATIESIPSEILRHTLKIGAQSILDDKTDWHFATKMKRRNEFLLIASLVCSVWRIEAQAVLWDMLHIGSERAAQRLLQSPLLGSLPTKELTLVGRGMDVDEAADSTDGELQITAASVTTILSSMVELRMLDMFSFPGWAKLDLNLFCLESLRGLISLNLCDTHFHSENVPLSKPPFALRSLDLQGYKTLNPSHFTFFPSSSITFFRIGHQQGQSSDQEHDLMNLLATIGGNLTHLELYNCMPSMLAACAYFTSLENLALWCEDKEEDVRFMKLFFQALPSKLSVLEIGVDTGRLCSAMSNFLKLPCLEKLSRIIFLDLDAIKEVELREEGKAFVEALKKRNVTIVYGDQDE